MSMTFDQEKAFSYIYRYISGAYETTNLATATDFDLFPDTAGVGDAIYFGRYNPSWSFHDIKFNIGTALVATGITVAWEYKKNGVWTAIPGLTDGTNAFQNTGVNTVAFDIPENMTASSSSWYMYLTISGSRKYGNYIRCRITAVSGITEGGANQTDTVKFKDFTITCQNEPSLDLSVLQSASDAGGWLARSGVKAIETLGEHTIIRPHLYWLGTTGFAESMKMIELGETDYPAGFRNYGSGIFQLGILDASGKGDEGCYLYMHTRFDNGYDYVYRLQAYASVIRRRTGRYGAFAMGGVFKFIDSVFISDNRWYLPSSVASGSEWTRSVYADPDLLYLYSGELVIDTFKTLDAWQGVLCGSGRPAVFSNTDINGKKIMRYYSADIDLVDCTNILTSNITSTAPNSHYESLHVRIKYKINLKIIDRGGNPISDATVKLIDVNGGETFSVVSIADGTIPEQTVMVYDKWWERDASWALHEDDYNDFTLKISKKGYDISVRTITILEPIDWTISLNQSRINIDQEVIA